MRVLLIAPYFNKEVPGESWSTYKWVQGISDRHETTILSTHKRDWIADRSPTNAKKIVNWIDPNLPKMFRRLEFELKPGYFLFQNRAKRWIKSQLRAGENFDIIHQINPLALRYPCPARNFGIPYIIGPLAGSLPTPPGFKKECKDRQWYRKLRQLDRIRLAIDPSMRRTYENAAAVLGVAPYVREVLGSLKIKRFESMSETGVERIMGHASRPYSDGDPLRLLFVGRIIRTKGVIDAIRAVSIAKKKTQVQFDIVGDGDMINLCRSEAATLGLSNEIRFHGRLPREEVEDWYRKSEVFLFPSFREPSGNVVFEAMSHGLPIIGAAAGGPMHLVDKDSGIMVEPRDPTYLANGLAEAIVALGKNRQEIMRLSEGAAKRVATVALWSRKIDGLMELYDEVAMSRN